MKQIDEKMMRAVADSIAAGSGAEVGEIPAYLTETYAWAYLHPASVRCFDRPIVVSAILWGNSGRLKRLVLAEIRRGQRVLQAACVYGDFSRELALHIGPRGRLDIVDIVPLQVANCRRKLKDLPQARVHLADAARPGGGPYDAVCCFFLLHEIPDDHKRKVVDGLLGSVVEGGKAIFVDYHSPPRLHPLRTPTGFVFDCLEPFAKTLWRREITSFASAAAGFTWRKETCFGGLYQKVVAQRVAPAGEREMTG